MEESRLREFVSSPMETGGTISPSVETRGSMLWVAWASFLHSEEQASAISELSHPSPPQPPEGVQGVGRSLGKP